MKATKLIPLLAALAAFSSAATAATLTYTTGLHVWLDASDIDGQGNTTLANGAAVATWTNKGTTGVNDAVAIKTGAAGGTDGVFVANGGLGGSQGAVQLSNTRYQFGQEFMASPNITAYFVVQRTGGGSQGTLLNDYGTTGSQALLVSTNVSTTQGRLFGRDSGNDTIDARAESLTANVWKTVFASLDGTGQTASYGFIGGAIASANNLNYDSTTTWNGAFAPPTLFGFHNGDNTHDFNGLVSEVLIFDHVLDAGARAQVETYLAAKAIPEPSSFALIAMAGIGLLRRRR